VLLELVGTDLWILGGVVALRIKVASTSGSSHLGDMEVCGIVEGSPFSSGPGVAWSIFSLEARSSLERLDDGGALGWGHCFVSVGAGGKFLW